MIEKKKTKIYFVNQSIPMNESLRYLSSPNKSSSYDFNHFIKDSGGNQSLFRFETEISTRNLMFDIIEINLNRLFSIERYPK